MVVSDQAEAVGQQTTDDLLGSVHHVPARVRSCLERVSYGIPVCHGFGLLLAFIPHAGHQDEGGLADGFEDTQQGANSDQAREVLAGTVQGQNCTPENDVHAEVFRDRDSLDDPVGRVFDKEHGDVDTGREPGVLPESALQLYYEYG